MSEHSTGCRMSGSRAVMVLCAAMLLAVAALRAAEPVLEEVEAPTSAQAPAMGLFDAAILGVVEGLTEYLPVSSTGHLILTQRLLGIGVETEAQKQAADAFAICIQAGAILAVLGLYHRRVKQMLLGSMGRDAAGFRLARNLLVGFVPAAIAGLLLNGWIKQHLFGLWPIIGAWAAGGLLILWIGRKSASAQENGAARGRALELLTWRMALLIGLFQCLAMWPGTSRALVTILGGLLVGLELAAAVEFSFLLGVLTLGAATGYDTLKHGSQMLQVYSLPPLVIGTLAAFLSAVCAVKWVVSYLQKHDLRVFGWYRIALAACVGGLLAAGWLKA